VERRVPSETELLRKVLPEDLIRFGFLKELIGRFSGIITLDPLSRADLLRILEEAPHSPLALKRRFFELHRVRLQLDHEGRAALVERAEACGLGARMLQTVVNESFAGIEYRINTLAPEGIGAARYSRAAIEGLAEPELIPVEELEEPLDLAITADELRHEMPKGPDVQQQEELKRKIKFRLAAEGLTSESEPRKDPRSSLDPPTLFDGPESN
jgi:ATP-dependent Clp protease ATP-binding subunit ClpX